MSEQLTWNPPEHVWRQALAAALAEGLIPVVVYGVKSSPDEKGAVADQVRIAREAIEKEGGRRIIGVFEEENQSGYRKARGPQLEAAMRAAAHAAAEHGHAELWVWHSSRLGRGTGKRSAASPKVVRALGKVLYDLQEQGVTVRSVNDNEFTTNEMFWGFASRQAAKYSEDLGGWTSDGIKRRRDDEGKPVGWVAFGYRPEPKRDSAGNVIVGKRNQVVTERVKHPSQAPVVEEILRSAADEATPGEIGRSLNSRRIRTARGNGWRPRAIRQIIANADLYAGGNGYPAIVSRELADAALAALRRMDPGAVQRRTSKRRPREDDYILRGFTFCACGAPEYCTRKYFGGERGYACREKLNSTGLCDRPPIRADILEAHVMNHLEVFIGSVQAWLEERAAEHSTEQRRRDDAIEVQRATLAKTDASREKLFAEYRRHIDEGSSRKADLALEAVERIDADREAQVRAIAEAEAVAAEWVGSPDINAALDYYNRIVDLVQGRIRKARGAVELNRALAAVLNGLWVEHDVELADLGRGPEKLDRRRLLVQFALRDEPVVQGPSRLSPAFRQSVARHRHSLPPVSIDSLPSMEPRDLRSSIPTTTPTSASRSSPARRGPAGRRGRVARS